MAIYFLNLKSFTRSDGSSAPGLAAYRAGERIRDERTGRIHDHTARQDVLHKEIVLPSGFADSEMSWARDRSILWNAAEAAERRRNSRVAREYLVALPVELDQSQRVAVVREFAQELVERYRFAMDVSIHGPRDFPGSDPRNFHAHLLATTREARADGLAAKTLAEMHDLRRRRMGLRPSLEELLQVRERWASLANAALERAHVEARIDHRAAQGLSPRGAPERAVGYLGVEETQRRAAENWKRMRQQMLAREAAGEDEREARHEGAHRDDGLSL
jgi:hypothetical protein